MGLRLTIFRGTFDSAACAYHGKAGVTLVNVPGGDEPDGDYPEATLELGPAGAGPIVKAPPRPGMAGPMFGGTYAHGEYSEAWQTALRALTGEAPRRQGILGAVGPSLGPVPVHDWFETWAQYEASSR